MLFRYDFADKLDLSKFRKQAEHYIGNMRQLTYHLFLQDYKVIVDIITPDGCNEHQVIININEIKRDNDGEITHAYAVLPANDIRFKEIKNITNIFVADNYSANFKSNNVSQTVDNICNVLKVVNKINKLKVFL